MLAVCRVFPAALSVLFALSLAGFPASAASYQEGLRAIDGKDYDLAYEIWKPLGEAGDALAQYSLGKLFEAGGGEIQQDFGEAQFWYGKAAEQGVPAAQNNLALMHAQGRGVERSVEQAIELWYEAAKSNHPMAQYNLGLAYLRGEGLVKDEREAAAWFRRSADSGLPEAQYAVGQMNRLGLVLPKDAETALAWYKKAADQGHKEADVQVQILEANGVTAGEIGPPTIAPEGLKTPAAVAAANARAKAEAQARAKAMAEERKRQKAAAEAKAATEDDESDRAEPVADTAAADKAPAQSGLPAVAADPVDPDGPAFTAAQSIAVESGGTGPSGGAVAADSEAAAEASQAEAEPARAVAEEPQIALAEAPATQTQVEHQSEDAAAKRGSTPPRDLSATPKAAAVTSTSGTGRDPVKVWIASATSEDEGIQFWQETQGKYPDLFSGTRGEVAKVDYGQGSTFFRLLAGPIASREAALDLCKEFRAREPGAFCKVQKD